MADAGEPPESSAKLRQLKLQRSGSLKPLLEVETTTEDKAPSSSSKDRPNEPEVDVAFYVKELQLAQVEIEKAREEKLATGEELGSVLMQLQEAQVEIEKLRQEKLESSEKLGEMVQELQQAQIDLEKLKAVCVKNGIDYSAFLVAPSSASEVELVLP
ncbi:unnamed protein product [Amoebophrya sp. A120]|nr:unnamed protein product [Amoebophrya sp. A120]|eukprot:GSA120T00020157001.1